MSFFALVENQDGQLKSALKICMEGLNFKHPLGERKSVVDSFMGRYYRRRRRSKEGDTTING
jgi:hypothetical protein